MARFQREAQVLASLSHPNIASIYRIEGHDALILHVMRGNRNIEGLLND